MSQTPEQAQLVTDLRSRMLANVQAGRPSWDGIDPEELRRGLEALRSGGRQRAAEAATKARKAKAEKGPAKNTDLSFLKDLGLDVET